MIDKEKSNYKSTKINKLFRKLHKQVSIAMFVGIVIITLSGILLAWKKHSFGLIAPPTAKGTSSSLSNWLPMDSLHKIAVLTLKDSISANLSPELDRIDARPQKGVVKFLFEDDYWEIQLDGAKGTVLQISRRNSDIIENIHDGTIFDVLFSTNNDYFKTSYSTIIGLTFLLLSITGFWLWYTPISKKRKASVKRNQGNS